MRATSPRRGRRRPLRQLPPPLSAGDAIRTGAGRGPAAPPARCSASHPSVSGMMISALGADREMRPRADGQRDVAPRGPASVPYCSTVCSRNRSCQPPTSSVGTARPAHRGRGPLSSQNGSLGSQWPATPRYQGARRRTARRRATAAAPCVPRRQPAVRRDPGDRRSGPGPLLVQVRPSSRASLEGERPAAVHRAAEVVWARQSRPRPAAPAAGRSSPPPGCIRDRRRRRGRTVRRTRAAPQPGHGVGPVVLSTSDRRHRPSRTCRARSDDHVVAVSGEYREVTASAEPGRRACG